MAWSSNWPEFSFSLVRALAELRQGQPLQAQRPQLEMLQLQNPVRIDRWMLILPNLPTPPGLAAEACKISGFGIFQPLNVHEHELIPCRLDY